MRRALAVLPALLALLAAPARAQGSPDGSAPELRVSWLNDGALVVVTGAGWVASEVGKARFAPASCRWCARNGLDDSVVRALAWKCRGAASGVSDAFTTGGEFP